MRLPLLALHISAGVVGMFSGLFAMSFRKGSSRHALAGNVFVIAMLTMAAAACVLALMKHDTNNFFGGLLTLYLVSTAWLTARRGQDSTAGLFDWAVFLFALGIGAVTLMHGVQKATGRIPSDDGVPFGMNLFMGSVILLAAAGDVRMLLPRGLSGVQRLSRHLWRMCFAWFIATGSFFFGNGAPLFPDFIRNSGVLTIPALLPLALLVFWMIRVRMTSAFRKMSTPRAAGISRA